MSTPMKVDREKCWNSRDNYWKCLDKNNDVVEACIAIRKEFEKHCSKQWVKHFDRKRKFDQFKAKGDEINWFVEDKKSK